MTLTRGEFHAAITPDLLPSVRRMVDTLRRAGVGADELAALYLVGGSVHVPLVPQLLSDELQVTPTTLDDPKTITALGALHADGSVAPAGSRRTGADLAGARSRILGP